MAPPICLAGIRDVDRFPLCRHFFPHWLSLLCTYTCARRFGYPQDTNGILRMPRYPQDASGILRIRYPQDTAVSSGYRVLRIPARVLGYGVPRIPPPILGICRCPQDAPRVPGRQLAFSDDSRCVRCEVVRVPLSICQSISKARRNVLYYIITGYFIYRTLETVPTLSQHTSIETR